MLHSTTSAINIGYKTCCEIREINNCVDKIGCNLAPASSTRSGAANEIKKVRLQHTTDFYDRLDRDVFGPFFDLREVTNAEPSFMGYVLLREFLPLPLRSDCGAQGGGEGLMRLPFHALMVGRTRLQCQDI
jgi:hypothetical protein